MIDLIDWMLIYLCVNCAAFLAFAGDKSSAQSGRWRVSEQTLLWMSFLGGVGAFAARRLFRHKTRKEPFGTQFRNVATLHVLAAVLSLPGVLARGAERASLLAAAPTFVRMTLPGRRAPFPCPPTGAMQPL